MNKIEIAISFENVSFRYKKKTDLILDNISFNVKKGSSLTVIGINGSGKSTIAKIISGLLLHFEGKVTIFDKILTEKNYQSIIKEVGFVFQNPENQFIGEDVENDIAFGLENTNVSPNEMVFKIKNIVQKLGLQSIFNMEPVNLSGGDKQKVAIASVLVTEPKIIIFDEPTSMLDHKAQLEILKIIDLLKKDPSITVIEITHDIERILFADQVLVMKEGKTTFFGDLKNLLLKRHLILDSSGLELPFIYKLSQNLKKNKIIDQIFLDEKELLNHLWNKKKSKLKI